MKNKRIITAALTGAGDTTEKSRHVPITPKEIAESAIESAKAGAAIAHIHVRDPKTGKLSHDVALFRETVERIRESDTDVIINITAGGGGDFVPNLENPTCGGEGTDIQTPKERHEPVGELLPELTTLDCGSLNFGNQVYLGPEDWLREHAKLIKESGVKPEMEVFDTGHIRLANQLISEGLVEGTPMYQFCLGIPWGADADAETIEYMKRRVVDGAHWSAFGIGRMQLPIVAQAALLGGNVRVGLEDNLYLEKGVLGTNEQLVDQAVSILNSVKLEPMTAAEAREHLNLKKFNS
ncbi:3-keto-5-aminohexanoate cleavage protein [Oceanobacillus oncorhynchi subsp. incaldanensis]|uniref:3-keto-5-aminohexanoate cleavage enzyme n=2 Tax=Oceanobacillus TaxID=182709 RepID=A0A0A1MXQ6_9BACI|nr:3-keto-5-aminohexanoate cleavage protein [Oceanobacillus oncorhynchi]MDM8101907.1 3-keto-5-aminohexanoate cleavage protein [Oceanobacillus oncorhynchi]UUI42068.1 3-keto-5-aminohexanoate cleavage protein [Oceanobacillus oncorhynchi]GIO17365.1 3-keto-5-aminohexanoate cleavage protein [Oceanobacillus oncorhynchi subsp. incaldanensis]CEI83591.1 3-keto-5-aminohexanoate cleavage enzyme [Oceanobacillus oncorhynchi]